MSRRLWQVEISGARHIIDLDWSRWTLAGRVTLNGRLVSQWGPTLSSKEIRFEVAGKSALLIFIMNPLGPNRQELYLDGIRIPESK